MQLSLFGSTYVRLGGDGAAVPLAGEEARFRAAGKGPWVADASGFNVHAGVTVRSGDREGLERLCRYCARPPFSLERLSMLPDGRVAYLLRKPRRNGATHLVMTPVQCLARIAALIPPPRFPLQRFSGVFAPRSPLRAAVVPSGPVARAGGTPTLPRARTKTTTRTVPDDASPWVATAEGTSPERERVAPSGRRTSLGDGMVKAAGTRIAWAQRLRRIDLMDVLACRYGGRRAIVVEIAELESVGAKSAPPLSGMDAVALVSATSTVPFPPASGAEMMAPSVARNLAQVVALEGAQSARDPLRARAGEVDICGVESADGLGRRGLVAGVRGEVLGEEGSGELPLGEGCARGLEGRLEGLFEGCDPG